jgi:hypothetical protein
MFVIMLNKEKTDVSYDGVGRALCQDAHFSLYDRTVPGALCADPDGRPSGYVVAGQSRVFTEFHPFNLGAGFMDVQCPKNRTTTLYLPDQVRDESRLGR